MNSPDNSHSRSALQTGSRTLLNQGGAIQRDSGRADPAEGPRVAPTLVAHETAPSHLCPVCEYQEKCVGNQIHACSSCGSEWRVQNGKRVLV